MLTETIFKIALDSGEIIGSFPRQGSSARDPNRRTLSLKLIIAAADGPRILLLAGAPDGQSAGCGGHAPESAKRALGSGSRAFLVVGSFGGIGSEVKEHLSSRTMVVW